MFCNKCGNKVSANQIYCNKCGNRLIYNNPNSRIQNNNKENNKKNISIVIILIIVFISVGYISSLISNIENYYYFDDTSSNNDTNEKQTTLNNENNKKSKYKTAIITDNVYSGISIKSTDDAYELISQDSLNQKKQDYPEEIIQIENDIINKYSVTAVNLKEMDVEFAKELENVIKNIYDEYPKARGYLTNLTLTNMDMSENGVIAFFMPVFTFGTSNTSSTTPWVIKTQVQLNAKYFLNQERIDAAVQASSKSGHFPKNATNYSPVAHELGHYLSFIALLNHYNTKSIVVVDDNNLQNLYDVYKDFACGDFSKQLLEEAYNNYLNNNPNIGFDEWRGQISGYALAKNDQGNYIYDETIAEAFHDVYLNKNNANEASKYIVDVLKKHIGN